MTDLFHPEGVMEVRPLIPITEVRPLIPTPHSIYLYPSAYFAERYDLTPDERLSLSATEVLVDYWLSADLDGDTDFSRMFIPTLQYWLLCDWGFTKIAWVTRPAMTARRSLYNSLAFEWERTAEAVNTKGWFQTFHISSGIGSKV
jgi:hypothetical protein